MIETWTPVKEFLGNKIAEALKINRSSMPRTRQTLLELAENDKELRIFYLQFYSELPR